MQFDNLTGQFKKCTLVLRTPFLIMMIQSSKCLSNCKHLASEGYGSASKLLCLSWKLRYCSFLLSGSEFCVSCVLFLGYFWNERAVHLKHIFMVYNILIEKYFLTFLKKTLECVFVKSLTLLITEKTFENKQLKKKNI